MHFIKNGHYYKILHDDKYYRLINPHRLFLFTIIPTPADATVTLTAEGYTQVGNTISVRSGTQVSWSVSKTGLPTETGTTTITQPTTLYVGIGYPSGEVLFESSTPGTYTLDVEYNCVATIHVVGGGGGGFSFVSPSGTAIRYYVASGGGSGAYVTGNVSLTPGSYSIVVGGGGTGSGSAASAASGGGSSSCFGQTAGGGGGGTSGAGGTAGVASTTLVGQNGNVGGYHRNNKHGSASGGASRYGGYGKGGDANTSTSTHQNGVSGYVKITVA